MQTRNVAVYDWLGKRLRTYAVALAQREDSPRDPEFAAEALMRARADRLVPGSESDGLTAKVPEKMKNWR